MRRSINGKGTVNKCVQFSSTSHVAIRHFKFDIKSGIHTRGFSFGRCVVGTLALLRYHAAYVEVLGQPIGLNFKGQAAHSSLTA